MKTVLAGVNSAYVHTNPAIRSMAAAAQRAGVEVICKEYNINQHMHHVLEELYGEKPDVAAFSCYIWNIGCVRRLAQDLKALLPDVKIVLGGPEVSYDARACLQKCAAVDYILCGEAEFSFVQLLCALESGGDPAGIDGLVYRREGRAQGSEKLHIVQDLSALPSPRLMFDAFEPHRIYYYESSRGCPFSCAYCLSGGDAPVREKPLDMVLEDIDYLVQNNVPLVKFTDRTFNMNRRRTAAIWEHIINGPGGTCFHFEIGLDLLDDDLLALLARVRPGIMQLEAGVQSCNEDTLRAVSRKTDIPKVIENARRVMQMGTIPLHLDLIAGLPHEDLESFGRSFDRLFDIYPDRLQLGFLKLLKGSALREGAAGYGIQYRDYPPYEVLETGDMSAGDLFLLKGIEELLNRYYNTGRAAGALYFAMRGGPARPFDFFRKLHGYCMRTGSLTRPVSVRGQFELLIDFGRELFDQSTYKGFLSRLKEDYIRTAAKGQMPLALHDV